MPTKFIDLTPFLSLTLKSEHLDTLFKDYSVFYNSDWLYIYVKSLFFHACKEKEYHKSRIFFQFLNFLGSTPKNIFDDKLQILLMYLNLPEFKLHPKFQEEISKTIRYFLVKNRRVDLDALFFYLYNEKKLETEESITKTKLPFMGSEVFNKDSWALGNIVLVKEFVSQNCPKLFKATYLNSKAESIRTESAPAETPITSFEDYERAKEAEFLNKRKENCRKNSLGQPINKKGSTSVFRNFGTEECVLKLNRKMKESLDEESGEDGKVDLRSSIYRKTKTWVSRPSQPPEPYLTEDPEPLPSLLKASSEGASNPKETPDGHKKGSVEEAEEKRSSRSCDASEELSDREPGVLRGIRAKVPFAEAGDVQKILFDNLPKRKSSKLLLNSFADGGPNSKLVVNEEDKYTFKFLLKESPLVSTGFEISFECLIRCVDLLLRDIGRLKDFEDNFLLRKSVYFEGTRAEERGQGEEKGPEEELSSPFETPTLLESKINYAEFESLERAMGIRESPVFQSYNIPLEPSFLTYRSLIVDNNLIYLEFKDKCILLSELDYSEVWNASKEKRINLARSGLGTYLIIYVFLVYDRHFENILCTPDFGVLNVDFGMPFGERNFVDSGKIPISRNFRKAIEEDWGVFEDSFVEAVKYLRDRILVLERTIEILFYGYEKKEKWLQKIKKRLMIGKNFDEKGLRKKIRKGVHDIKTNVKNTLHKFSNFFKSK